MQIYDNAIPRLNGRYFAHATSVGIQYKSSDEFINLLAGGSRRTIVLSPGGRAMLISWSLVVPSKNAEDLRLIRMWREAEEVLVGVDFMGSKLGISTRGFLQDPQLTGQVGQTFTFAISAVCEPKDFG